MYLQHVDFDGLPPEEIPDLEETRHSLFGASDDESEGEGQQQQQEERDNWSAGGGAPEAPPRASPRRCGTGWAPRGGGPLGVPPSSSGSSRSSSIEKPQVLREAELHALSGMLLRILLLLLLLAAAACCCCCLLLLLAAAAAAAAAACCCCCFLLLLLG